MADFDGRIGVIQDNDILQFVCILRPNKKKLQVLNEKNREQSINDNKVLWFYPDQVANNGAWLAKVAIIKQKQAEQLADIDIELLWESAQDLASDDISDLADLYFDAKGTIEKIAIWQALAQDGLYFKRKGTQWQYREQEQISALRLQRDREQERIVMETTALTWLEQAIKAKNSCTIADHEIAFVDRIYQWLHGHPDKDTEKLLQISADKLKQNTRELAFELLQKAKKIPLDADRDIIISGLEVDFSSAIHDAANHLSAWQQSDDEQILSLDFSIDDPDTREVDDALGIHAEGDLWRIDIAIADPASFIQIGDSLDTEARHRSTTVYLPTQTILMLPPIISYDIASLSADKPRPSIVMSATLNQAAEIQHIQIQRRVVTVNLRLDYDGADVLLGSDDSHNETAVKLQQMAALTEKLQAQRIENGALMIQRSEFKINVDKDKKVSVKMLENKSASRELVAELMILANHQSGRFAEQEGIDLIFRKQSPPEEPISREVQSDPLVFQKIGRLLKPSSLSLEAGEHSGLGLSVYTQVTSPLRRFADLVMQRQLIAHIHGKPLPYDQEELFKILAISEQKAKQSRRLENEATRRWFIQYLEQQHKNANLDGRVMAAQKIGYKVNLLPWGVDGWLNTNDELEAGALITVKIDQLRFKTGQIRLKQV